MNSTDPIFIWGNIALLLMALGFNIFAIYYGVKTKWNKEPLGPAVLALFGFLALTLDYFFAVSWFGDFTGRYIIRASFLTAAAGAVFWHLGWLIYVQRKHKSGTVETGGKTRGEAAVEQAQRPVGREVANDRRTRLGPGRDVIHRPGRDDSGA